MYHVQFHRTILTSDDREIADKQFNAQDTKGPRSFSKFLIRLAEVSPRLVLKQIALLQKHLDSEVSPPFSALRPPTEDDSLSRTRCEMRSSKSSDSSSRSFPRPKDLTQMQTNRSANWKPSSTSSLSASSTSIPTFVPKLPSSSSRLASTSSPSLPSSPTDTVSRSLPTKFPKLRIRLTDLTIRSLEDKSSQVRKNCIALLTRLILTHPYGRMHGGELSIGEWQGRYDALEKELRPLDLPSAVEAAAMAEAKEMMADVEDEEEAEEEGEEEVKEEEVDEQEGSEDDGEERPPKPAAKTKGRSKPRKSDGIDLAAADQSQLLASVDQDTLTRLRLTKKYYADAIAFIEQLDRAMETVGDLLASTVKSEVLEAMEFFRVAKDYKIDSAEVRPRPSSPPFSRTDELLSRPE